MTMVDAYLASDSAIYIFIYLFMTEVLWFIYLIHGSLNIGV